MPGKNGRFHARTRGPRLKTIASTVILDRAHLLMVRQGKGADRGKWNLPGGKVDRGETLVEAAVRETQEETGYEVMVRGLTGMYRYATRAGNQRMRIVFRAGIQGGAPAWDDREIIDVCWMDLDRLNTMADKMLAKPQVLRRVFADLRRPVAKSLDLLGECDHALTLV